MLLNREQEERKKTRLVVFLLASYGRIVVASFFSLFTGARIFSSSLYLFHNVFLHPVRPRVHTRTKKKWHAK